MSAMQDLVRFMRVDAEASLRVSEMVGTAAEIEHDYARCFLLSAITEGDTSE